MTKKKTSDQYDDEIKELAVQARNLFRRVGAFIDPNESDERKHGYLTVAEICEFLGVPKYKWREIKKKMLALYYPLTIDEFGGHYLGAPGSQAKNPAMLLTRALTMLETAAYQITVMKHSPDNEICMNTLSNLLDQSRHDVVVDNLEELLTTAGIEFKLLS